VILLNVSSYFFDKEVIQQIVRETGRYAEQHKNSRGNLFPFWLFVRLWTPVTENKICTILGLFLMMGIVPKPTARSYFLEKEKVMSASGFMDVISSGWVTFTTVRN
jgi:hypothetical protein